MPSAISSLDQEEPSPDDVCTCGHRRALHDPDCAFGGQPCQCKAFELRNLDPVPLSPWAPCRCGHTLNWHRGNQAVDTACYITSCACKAFEIPRAEEVPLSPEEEEGAPEDQDGPKAPPQPERRPPYAVAYSANGHLYELLLPGDAWAVAEDGVLKISHGSDPVLGIVRVVPVRMEGSGNAADAEE